MPSNAEKRLQREFERLQKVECPFPIMDVIQIDLFHWKAMINASDRSPFAGGNYWINIEFPHNYPIKPPIVKFITQIYHPNISENGQIDVQTLKEQCWSPVRTINHKLLLTIAAILNQPINININNYLHCMKYNRAYSCGFRFNKECVILYTQNRLLYEEVANDSAVTNAGATRQYNLMDIFVAIRELLFMGLGENSAFDIEAVLMSYTGLNIKKLNKWCRELKLDRDNRYKRFLVNRPKVFDRKLIEININYMEIQRTVWNDSTIKDFKRQIQVTSPMIFNGEILCDNDIIAHRGIINGSLLHVVPPYELDCGCSIGSVGSVRNLLDEYRSNDEGISHEQSISYSGVHLPGSYNRSLRHNPMK